MIDVNVKKYNNVSLSEAMMETISLLTETAYNKFWKKELASYLKKLGKKSIKELTKKEREGFSKQVEKTWTRDEYKQFFVAKLEEYKKKFKKESIKKFTPKEKAEFFGHIERSWTKEKKRTNDKDEPPKKKPSLSHKLMSEALHREFLDLASENPIIEVNFVSILEENNFSSLDEIEDYEMRTKLIRKAISSLKD